MHPRSDSVRPGHFFRGTMVSILRDGFISGASLLGELEETTKLYRVGDMTWDEQIELGARTTEERLNTVRRYFERLTPKEKALILTELVEEMAEAQAAAKQKAEKKAGD